MFPKTLRQPYGQTLLHGYSGNRFSTDASPIAASIHPNGHQLRSGIDYGHSDLILKAQGMFNTPPPLIQLPAPLFTGSTTTRGASNHFGNGGDTPRWGDSAAGPALQQPRRLAEAAQRH